MLHLIWYVIVGFLAGCVAKALLHTHLSIMWTIYWALWAQSSAALSRICFTRQALGVDFTPAV